MGRPRLTTRKQVTKTKKIPYCKNPVEAKNRHRFSDMKYRNKVNFFYDLFREDFEPNLTKDALLEAVSKDIQRMQKDIVFLAGSLELERVNAQYLEIVQEGEHIWKKEKDPSKWWIKVQEIMENALNKEESSR